MPTSHGPVYGRQPIEQAKCWTASHLIRIGSWPRALAVFSMLLFLVCTVAPVPAQDESPDDLMYDQVIRKLVNDRQLKTNALEVSVKNAVVTVSGEVENEKLRRRVEKVVKKVKGVKGVVNNVRARN